VAIAAEDGATGQTLVGVVHVPVLSETYVAVLGRGAVRLDADGEHALSVSGCTDLAMALIGTGFGYRTERRRSQARVFASMLPRVRDVRRGGSAAIDLCWVASGRVDGYFERGLQPWDLAAAALVAAEAGAVVVGLAGAPASEELVIAAGPGILDAMHDVLLALDAASDRV
jgi:myo-inositol-1(or 4)-monophosphatase